MVGGWPSGCLDSAQRLIVAAVVAARAAGYSWASIALALNVSRQAAHERDSGSTSGPDTVIHHDVPGKVRRTAPTEPSRERGTS